MSSSASRFSAVQRKALDAIGRALRHRSIDFHTAAELSDMVKAGKMDKVAKKLEQIKQRQK